MKKLTITLLAGFVAASFSSAALALDVDAAKDLLKQNKCSQCHGMSSDKDGPALKKIAAKFKTQADGEAKIVEHLMTGPKVKLADGTEEEHKAIKTTPAKDKAQVSNVAKYILSL